MKDRLVRVEPGGSKTSRPWRKEEAGYTELAVRMEKWKSDFARDFKEERGKESS